jgi:hypothetical protein
MHYQWVLDVLGDLKAFSQQNGMHDLAAQMDVALTAAASDIARMTNSPVLVFTNPAAPATKDEAAGGPEAH